MQKLCLGVACVSVLWDVVLMNKDFEIFKAQGSTKTSKWV